MPDEDKPETIEKASSANLQYQSFSNGINRYLELVEHFFPYAAAQLSLRQYAQHAGETDKYLPEELEMERDELRDQLSGILPRAIRGSALVVLYSAFESTVMDFSKGLASDLQSLPFAPSSGTGSFLMKANKYFATVFEVQLFSGEVEKTGINILRALRNSFIHQQSAVARLSPAMRASIETPKTNLTKCHVHQDTWVPSVECIRSHGELVQHWARLLGQRVFERVGIQDL